MLADCNHGAVSQLIQSDNCSYIVSGSIFIKDGHVVNQSLTLTIIAP